MRRQFNAAATDLLRAAMYTNTKTMRLRIHYLFTLFSRDAERTRAPARAAIRAVAARDEPELYSDEPLRNSHQRAQITGCCFTATDPRLTIYFLRSEFDA